MKFPHNKKRLTAFAIFLVAATANFIGIGHSRPIRGYLLLAWMIALVIAYPLNSAGWKEEQAERP